MMNYCVALPHEVFSYLGPPGTLGLFSFFPLQHETFSSTSEEDENTNTQSFRAKAKWKQIQNWSV